ncbi:hypothetical protein ACE6H2_003069 [Prunus campanulata]
MGFEAREHASSHLSSPLLFSSSLSSLCSPLSSLASLFSLPLFSSPLLSYFISSLSSPPPPPCDFISLRLFSLYLFYSSDAWWLTKTSFCHSIFRKPKLCRSFAFKIQTQDPL